jgi:hypothetical protein
VSHLARRSGAFSAILGFAVIAMLASTLVAPGASTPLQQQPPGMTRPSTGGSSFTTPVTLSPPYFGFQVGHKAYGHHPGCSPGSGGGWGRVDAPAKWNSTTGRFSFKGNVSSSSSCWRIPTSGNRSGAWIDQVETLTLPFNYSGGPGGLTLNLNGSLNASYKFNRQGPCTYNATQRKTGSYCYDDAGYSAIWYLGVEDLTNNSSYCAPTGGSACLPSPGFQGDRYRVGWPCQWNCYGGPNAMVSKTFNQTDNLSIPFSNSHHYALVVELWVDVHVTLDGWSGTGRAGLNMAGNGHGAYLESVRIW